MKTRSSFRHHGPRPASVWFGIVAIAIANSVVHAVDVNAPDEARDDVATVGPFLSEQTIVVAKFDMPRLNVPKLDDLAGRPEPVRLITSDGPVEDLDEGWMRTGIQATDEWLRAIRAASGGQPIYAIGDVPDRWPGPWSLLFTPASDEVDREALVRLLRRFLVEPQSYDHAERVVVSNGNRESVAARLEHHVPSSRTEPKEAFQAVARFPIQILFVPPDHLRRTVAELMPQVPDAWGGGSSEIWTEGVLWAAVGFDPAQMDAVLVVRSGSEQAATRLGLHVEATLDQAIASIPPEQNEHAPWQWLLPLLRKQLVAERQDARWTVRLDDESGSELTASLFLTTVARLGYQVNELKRIVLAMHHHWSAFKVLPPRDEYRDEQGRPYLSWRVHLLPFLEHSELYQQFRLDEPWDSPHNRTLIEKMPGAYASSQSGVPKGHTTFLAPVGEDTIFGGDQETTFRYIVDGMRHTVAVVEVQADRAVPWTAPEDYAFDPQDPGAGLRRSPDGKFSAALMDGNVVRLNRDVAAEVLLRLFQKSDGKVVDWEALR